MTRADVRRRAHIDILMMTTIRAFALMLLLFATAAVTARLIDAPSVFLLR